MSLIGFFFLLLYVCLRKSLLLTIWHSNHTHRHMHTRLTQCVKTEDFFLNCVTNVLFQRWLHSIKRHSACSNGHTCMGLYRLQTYAPLIWNNNNKKKSRGATVTADAEEIHFTLFNHTEATTTMIALRKRCLTTLEDGSCKKVGDENRGLKIEAKQKSWSHKSSNI